MTVKNVTAETNVVPAIKRDRYGSGFEAQDNLASASASASTGWCLADRDVLIQRGHRWNGCGPSPPTPLASIPTPWTAQSEKVAEQ